MQCVLKFVFLFLLLFLGFQYGRNFFSSQNSLDSVSIPIQIKSGNDFESILKAKALRNRGKKCGFIGLDSFVGMRTGNRLFLYAFAFGIAKKLNRSLAIPPKIPLLHGIFNISRAIFRDSNEIQKFETLYELYERDRNFSLIGLKTRLECEKNYVLRTYVFSFRYFEPYENEIRQEFQFLPEFRNECEKE